MHPAQGFVTDSTDVADLPQFFIIEHAGHVPQSTQQGRALPLQGLFMLETPGSFMVMHEDWLISIFVARMLYPPGIKLLIEGLLVELSAHLDPGFAVCPILAQSIGLKPGIERQLALIGLDFGPPQTGFTVGQDDLPEPVDPGGLSRQPATG